MDEYLFIVMAKLGADRLKLEREARAASLDQHAFDSGSETFDADLLGEQS